VTAAKAGTKSFWLQYRNRAGFSLISPRRDLAIAVGGGVTITIPGNALPTPNGCCIWEYIILMSATTNPVEACVVASYPGYQVNEITANTPPFVIYLTTDEQLELYKIVPDMASLPVGTDRFHGMRRNVESINQIVAWDQVFTQSWIPVFPTVFNTYITNVLSVNGMSRDIAAISDQSVVVFPDYGFGLNEISKPIGFWVVNDQSADMAQGLPITLSVSDQTGKDVSSNPGIIGGLQLRFRGYVNVLTGVLDTSGMTISSQAIPYEGKLTSLTLPKPLPPNTAYWLDVQLQATVEQMGNRIQQGSVLKFYPGIGTTAAYFDPSDILGEFIAADGGLRRVVPLLGLQAKALSGSGRIAMPTGGGYSFHNVGEQAVSGLVVNTANQKAVVDFAGNCYVAGIIPSTGALRALIGTINGVGRATNWSNPIVVDSNKLLRVVVTHPTAIRLDYPDGLAGVTDCEFNATSLRIYVREVGGTEISLFTFPLTPNTASDTALVGGIAGAALGSGALPDRPNDNFGLFEPQDDSFALSTITGASIFTAGSVQVAIAFEFVNAVTQISHATADGCIYEATGTLSELFDHLGNLNNPHQTGFKVVSNLSNTTPDFVDQIFLNPDTGQIYRAFDTVSGALSPVGGSSADESFALALIFG
jgi:hypothetical protein